MRGALAKKESSAVSSWGFSGYLEVLPPEPKRDAAQRTTPADEHRCVEKQRESRKKG